MSPANVQITRRAIDAFSEGDLDGAIRDAAPEIKVDWSRSHGVEAGIYAGSEAVRAFWSTFLDTFDRITVSADEFIECGEHVVVPNRARAWGRDGITVEARSAAVATLGDARILEWRLYHARDEALKAVGLEG